VLQERAFERVGGTRTIEVDIRLIAASNRDLEVEVESGRFRLDLYYRLNVVPLHLPSLRERREDVPVLAAHFAAKAAEKYGRANVEFDPAVASALQTYEWPGNIRELENLVERLVVLSGSGRLGVEHLPTKMLAGFGPRELADALASDEETTFEGAVHALKRRLIANAIRAEGGNKAAAAKRLQISRSYLHRLITELDINDLRD
jgi:DNA-binding NtrC family response regulator